MTCGGCGKEIVRALWARLHSWEKPGPYCNKACLLWAQIADVEDAVLFNSLHSRFDWDRGSEAQP